MSKLLVTGGAGFLEYEITLGFVKILRVMQYSQNGGINKISPIKNQLNNL